jgi:hypothetical protein
MTASPLDDRIGLTGFLSPQATRLVCLAATSWSFDVAADRLAEFAGVTIDDETLRRHCHKAAAALTVRREATAPAAESFAAAAGAVEFLTDGVMAPTRDGWREVKLALFLKRPPGDPAEPEDWATRELPRATAQAAFAEVVDCERFSSRWGPRAKALGIEPAGVGTVLADGAEWIWKAASREFPEAGQVLDIFHASQHLASTANALFGDGSALAAAWTAEGRRALLADGWPGLCDRIGTTLADDVTPTGREAIDEMVGYFAKHTDRLGYYGRLRSGRSIGSGPVEGLARRMGDRLKCPGRGWLIANLEAIATLVATVETPEWDLLWKSSTT